MLGRGALSLLSQRGSKPSAVALPLDQIAVLPMFAYSTKKLRAGYAGAALRVVRPSDSVTQDIGFVGQILDTAAINTFLGAQVGHVDIWYDQTGNANHATQTTDANRPFYRGNRLIGGSPALSFESSFFTIPNGVSVSALAFDVYLVLDFYTSMLTFALHQLGIVTNYSTVFALDNGNTLGVFDEYRTGVQGLKQQSRPLIYSHRGTATSTVFQQGDEALNLAAQPAGTLVGGYVGNLFTGGYQATAYYSCHMGFNGNLSVGDASTLRAALAQLYAVANSVPTSRVIFDGDSIVVGFVGANNFSYMRQMTLPASSAVYNVGQGGVQLTTKLSYFPNETGALLSLYTANSRVVFLNIGTNDLTIGARTAAQIYADIQTYAGNVRAGGGKIIVSTITPNNAWTTAQQTTRDTLNTSIRTNWATFADGFADFAANSTMGPQAAAANTALYIDGLHPTALGHSYLAPVAQAAITALLP